MRLDSGTRLANHKCYIAIGIGILKDALHPMFE
jgi:hypothetical protein